MRFDNERGLKIKDVGRFLPSSFFLFSFILVIFFVSFIMWRDLMLHDSFDDLSSRESRILDSTGKILQLDEILTMSAKMAAATNDMVYEKRYRRFEPILDEAIKSILTIYPITDIAKLQDTVNSANIELVAMENDAFGFVKNKEPQKALMLLDSDRYVLQKTIYADGINRIIAFVQKRHASEARALRDFQAKQYAILTFLIVVLLLMWMVLLRSITLRIHYENELRKERNNLEELVRERTKISAAVQKQMEFVLGATKTGLDIIDSDYNMVYIDPEWQKVYGDFHGKKCYEYFMEKPQICPTCGVAEAFRTKKPVVTEEILVREGNRPIQVTTIPYRDDAGNWLVAEINVDMTEIKKATAELDRYRMHLEKLVEDRTKQIKASEAKYRMLFESAKDGIIILDAAAGKIMDVNPFILDMLGYTAEELIGKEFLEIGNFKDIVESKEKFSELQSKGYVRYDNLPLETKGGEVKEVEFVSSKYQVDHQEIIQCNIRDITDRRRTEAALEISEANYHAIFELASDAIIVRDIETYRIVDLNEQACELLCYPKAELVGTSPETILPDEPPNNWKYAKTIYDKASLGEPQSVELMLKDKAGRTFWVETHMKRAIIGGSYRLLSIAHDISERKESEKKIEELASSLAIANEELKKIALVDSHTGLYNYHYYGGVIEAEFSRAQRQGTQLSLIMMDIDYFKSINDVYGHQFGDMVLKQLAEILKNTVRPYDTVVRFGGEEFIIIAPGAGNNEALGLTKRILSVVDSRNFGDKTRTVKFKISAAIGSYPDDPRIRNSADFLNIADEILGHAKEEGGNRVYSSLNITTLKKTTGSDKEADIAELKEKIWKLTARGNQSVAEAIFAFAKTIEMKDHYTGDHVSDTIYYAARIAEKLKLPEHTVETVRHAAALHDLGKVGIPENILHKKSKLSDEEYDIVKRHPQIGVDIIRPIHFLHEIIPAMLHHHERWDGSGYPYGLKGDAIPLGARIVAVADAYQAMISDRPYRKAISQGDAVNSLKKNSGTQFDPEIVEAFLDVLLTESKSSKYKK